MGQSAYQLLSEKERDYIRKRALAYYHKNKESIRVKRKTVRDTNPDYKIKRAKRESSSKYKRLRQTYYLHKIYGITLETRNRMYAEQDGKCAICLESFSSMSSKHMHVDHNHATGKIRQLLCSGCNCALGNLNEDVALFERAVKYLEKWRTNE
jgi:hypothetical protein